MATWNSRGLRGSTLEEFINRTNEKYLENGLALIQKVPTPITPINIDKATRHITLAYFDQKSTVDYIGAVQGIPVCFDASALPEKKIRLQFFIAEAFSATLFCPVPKFQQFCKPQIIEFISCGKTDQKECNEGLTSRYSFHIINQTVSFATTLAH